MAKILLLGFFAFVLYRYAHRDWNFLLKLLAIAFFGLAFAFFVFLAGFEQVCPWNPWIDTVTAQDFSDEKFKHIEAGMTMDEVKSILGEPLNTRGGLLYGEDKRWAYTEDGKCFWWDFAWEGREVVFNDGRVVWTKASTNYN